MELPITVFKHDVNEDGGCKTPGNAWIERKMDHKIMIYYMMHFLYEISEKSRCNKAIWKTAC